MKAFRVFVLLLLALLLPIRGAVAATMVCAERGQAGPLAALSAHQHRGPHLAVAGPVAGHAHDGARAQDGHHAHHAEEGAMGASSDGASSDTCHICASGCGVAALLTAFPTTVAEPPARQAPFPGVGMPALDFRLDGQDRPPRAL